MFHVRDAHQRNSNPRRRASAATAAKERAAYPAPLRSGVHEDILHVEARTTGPEGSRPTPNARSS